MLATFCCCSFRSAALVGCMLLDRLLVLQSAGAFFSVRTRSLTCSSAANDADRDRQLIKKNNQTGQHNSCRRCQSAEAWCRWVLHSDPAGCYDALSEAPWLSLRCTRSCRAGRLCHGTPATCLQSLGQHESGMMSQSEKRSCPSGAMVALEVKRGHIMGLILGDGSRMLSIVQLHACICLFWDHE